MSKKLRWFLLFLTVIILIFASELNKMHNYEEMPFAQLNYTDDAGESSTEKNLPLVGKYWKEANYEGDVDYKASGSPLSSGGTENSDENADWKGIRLSEENSAIDLVYTFIPSEKVYQYSIVKAWALEEIEEATAGADSVMEEDVFSERIAFMKIADGIRLDGRSGYLYRVTSFWGDEGEYTTHEFIVK